MERQLLNQQRDAGFTLMELMVVISIIAILAALIFPSIQKGKQRVEGIICLNNLKQWGLATQLYVLENDDWLPKDGAPNGTSKLNGWYVDLPKQLGIPNYHTMPWRTNKTIIPSKSIWICPANRTRSNGINLFHYCLNGHVNGSGVGNQIKMSSVQMPSQTIWLFDNGRRAAVAQYNNVHTNLHQQGAQFSFLDAHSAWFPNSAYWNFKINKGKLGHPKLKWFPFPD